MIKGIYNTAASMVPRVRKQETIANNLANAETAGFKKDSIFLRIFKAEQQPGRKASPSWEVRMIDKSYTNFSSGVLEPTGRDLDVAIQGEGFFAIQTEQGEAYTRNGSFTLATDGTLINPDGLPVLTDSGPIALEGGKVSIGIDGEISVDGTTLGRLRVVDFDQPYPLTKLSGSLFVAHPEAQPTEPESVVVRQGYLERSNVDVLREMVEMIDSYRAFETGQKMIQIQDESLGKAVTELGRV